MVANDDTIALSEHERERARFRKRRALVVVLQIYAVLGGVFALIAAAYFLMLFYGIELSPEQRTALLMVFAGISVSITAASVARLLKGRPQYVEVGHFFPKELTKLLPPDNMVVATVEENRSTANVGIHPRLDIIKYLPRDKVPLTFYSAYFVTTWGQFEDVCRAAVRPILRLENTPFGRVLDAVAHQNFLSPPDVLLARECLNARNDVVHGRQQREPDDLMALASILEDLTAKVRSVARLDVDVARQS